MSKKDYDEVLVKVKKQNKSGEDITGDSLGSGGRRRMDGTLSSQYYDPRPYSPETERCPGDQQCSYANEPQPQKPLNPLVKVVIDVVVVYTIHCAEKAFNRYVIPAARNLWRNKIVPSAKSIVHGKKAMSKEISTKTKSSPQAVFSPQVISNQVGIALDEYRQDMSDGEKQQHLIKITVHYMCLVKELQAMKGVPVTDADWQEALRRMTSPMLTNSINRILTNNPALLTEGESKMLSELLGTEIIVDGEFIPIENRRLKKTFM